MFDKLRSSLGMKPKAFSSGAGHTLGGADKLQSGDVSSSLSAPTLNHGSNTGSNSSSGKVSAPSSPRFSAGPVEYDVTFTGTTLGLTFTHPLRADGQPDTAALRELNIHGVTPGSESETLGIKAGDVVLVVAGNPVGSYDAFVMLVKALERPLPVRLRRSAPAGSSSTLSAAELAARREMNHCAAVARGSAWEKRVAAASSRRKGEEEKKGSSGGGVHAHAEAARKGDCNPATQQAAALARQQEARLAQLSGGFSAFKPLMSFSSGSGGGAGTASALGGANAPAPAPVPGVFAGAGNALGGIDVAQAVVEDTDLALGLLLSVEAGTCAPGSSICIRVDYCM